MSVWWSKNLGDGVLAWQPLGEIEDRFALEQAKAGDSGDMAVFVRHESDGRLHCEVVVYFSPAAAAVANAFDAVCCERPSAHGLGLLAGSQAAWSALFPESIR